MSGFLNIFKSKNDAAASASLESVLPANGGDNLAPSAVPVVAKRIDLLTALAVRCPGALKFSKSAGHSASLLHHAVQQDGNREAVRFLLERQPDLIEANDAKNGGLALHWAANVEAVEMLVEAGGDLNQRSETNGETPLGTAIRYDRKQVASVLVELGCDLNAPLTQGRNAQTALHQQLAQKQPSLEFIALLIAYGADVNLAIGGESPRHLVGSKASSSNGPKVWKQMLSLLHVAGARRCPAGRSGCWQSCSANGTYDGEPVDGYPATLPVSNEFSAIFEHATVTTEGENVLCLDDGFVEGLSAVLMLRQIEATSGKRLIDYFQVLAGTGLGGLIGLYLTYLPAEKALLRAQQFFYFSRKKRFLPGGGNSKNASLEHFFKTHFGPDLSFGSPLANIKLIITGKALSAAEESSVRINSSEDQVQLAEQEKDCGTTVEPEIGSDEQPNVEKNAEVGGSSGGAETVDEEALEPKSNNQTDVTSLQSNGSSAPRVFEVAAKIVKSTLSQKAPCNCAKNPTVDVLTEMTRLQLGKRVFVSIGASTASEKLIKSGVEVKYGEGEDSDVVQMEPLIIDRQSYFEDGAMRSVMQSQAWCRDVGCTYVRLGPPISQQLTEPEAGEERNNTLMLSLFQVRSHLSQVSEVMGKLTNLLLNAEPGSGNRFATATINR